MCILCELAAASGSSTATSTSKVSLSLSDGAQKLLSANASWANSTRQTTEITYGFRASAPSYNSEDINQQGTFSKVSTQQMEMIRLALKSWSDVANIKFVEVNPGTYTDNAVILFGNYVSETDGANGFAYYPSNKNTSFSSREGDVWLNDNGGRFQSVQLGSFNFNTIAHEIGHALGLSHPGDYNADPGIAITYENNAEFREDTNQFSIMSYFEASTLGADHGNEYSLTPLLLDIIAIQKIYGRNDQGSSTDSVYGYNSNRGAPYSFSSTDSNIFSIWDTGGNDTLDASYYVTNQNISLLEGTFSDIGAYTKNISIALGSLIENASGGSGNDVITGNSANNSLYGGAGNDWLDGGAGIDIARYAFSRSEYGISRLDGNLIIEHKITNRDGRDTIINIERIDFTDGDLIFDVASVNAPAAYRLYGGAFDRTPDESGFRYWTSILEKEVLLRDVATQFINSPEFIGRYGSTISNSAFVNALYQNVLDRGGDAGGVAHWNKMLDNKLQDRSDVLVQFTQLPEFVGISAANIDNGYWVV